MSLVEFNGLGSTLRPGRGCRRRHRRLDLDWSGRLTTRSGPVVCWVGDLSLGGARLGVPHKLRPTPAAVLTIDGVGDFLCQVCWLGQRTLGVRFAEPPERLARVFARHLPAAPSTVA